MAVPATRLAVPASRLTPPESQVAVPAERPAPEGLVAVPKRAARANPKRVIRPALPFLLAATGCATGLVGPSFERFDLTKTPTANDYPDVPAVVLLDRGEMLFTADPERLTPVARLRRYHRVKILRDTGTELRKVYIPYDPGSLVTDVIARAYLPDGDTESIAGEVVDIEHSSGRPAKAFIFDPLPPGTVIEYAYDHYFKDLRFLPPWRFRNRLPTVRSEIALIVPPAYQIDYRFLDVGERIERPPERFEVDDGTRLFWSMTRQPAIFKEPYMPTDDFVSPQLRLNWVSAEISGKRFDGFASWESVREWFAERAGAWWSLSPKQAGEARRIAGDTSAEEQALKLLAVVARDLGWDDGAALPVRLAKARTASISLDLRKGNLTSRGLLLVALMRAAGLDAYPAVASFRDRGRLFPDVPDGWALDAVVAVMPQASGPLILDPTQLTVNAAVPSPRLQGSRLVMFRDDTAELIQVPLSAATDSRTRIRYDLTVDPDGTAVGTLSAKLTGAEAGLLRRILLTNEAATYPDIVTSFLGARGAALGVQSTNIADLAALRRPLTLTGSVRVPGVMSSDGGTLATLPLGKIIGLQGPRLAEIRRLPVELGPPHVVEIRATVTFPEDHEPTELPPTLETEWDRGATSIIVRRETDRRIGIKRTDEHRTPSIPVREYRELLRHRKRIRATEDSEVLIQRPPPRTLEY